MSVGTESIKRASAKAAGEEAEETKAEVKTAGTEGAPKKTKASGAKKTAEVKTSVIPDISPEVAEKMGIIDNEAYYMGEELPVYLL